MNRFRINMSMLLLFILVSIILNAQANRNNYTDYHVHLQDSATVKLGYRLLKAIDQAPSKIDSMILDADTILDRLNRANFKSAWVLSNAYLFGSPFTPIENEYEEVKKQNDWAAGQAARYPGRLIAFMSINPLKPYALDEIRRCVETKHFTGLKLHFANSKVDLLNKVELAQLQKVFTLANKNRLIILVHFRSDEKWNAKGNTEILLKKLIPLAKETKVVIAHMAGWGGYDKPTDTALNMITQYIHHDYPGSQNLYVELSAVLPVKSKEGGSPAAGKNTWNAMAAFQERTRQIGRNHILFGTDWPLIDIYPYIRLLNSALGTSMVQQILKNSITVYR